MLNRMSGYVYVIRFGEYVKIGYSADPFTRMRSLAWATTQRPPDTQDPPVPIAAVPGDHRTEHMLHVVFHNERAVGEYFWYRGAVKDWCDRLLLQGADLGPFDPPKIERPPEIKYVYVRCNDKHVTEDEHSDAHVVESEVEPTPWVDRLVSVDF